MNTINRFEEYVIATDTQEGYSFVIHKEDIDSIYTDYGIEENNLSIIEYKDFTAEHIVEITESELENANYHELVSTPSKFLKRLIELDKFDQDELRMIIQNFAETILEYV